MIDNIKALNRLETTKDYLKELYREQVENCPYPELKAIAKQTYEDNQMAFNIAIKAIKESNRQQAEIQALEMDNKQLETDNFNANMNCEHLQAEIERLKEQLEEYPFKCKVGNNSEIHSKSIQDYDRLIDDIQAEAVKEFAERLKKEIDIRPTYSREQNKYVVFLIDNLLKEMVGEVWDDMEVLK